MRLPTAAQIRERLSFPGSGEGQNPTLIAMRLDGRGLPGARAVLVLLNAAPQDQALVLADEAGSRWTLHPVQQRGADARVRERARFTAGRFEVPARSAAVFLLN